MECALWLNRQKVFSAEEIKDNLDAASLLGYFAAGSLIKWLRCHNGEDYADRLECLSPDDPDILAKISEIFGGELTEFKALGTKISEKSHILEENGSAEQANFSSFSQKNGKISSFSFGNGSLSSFSFGNGSLSSFSFGNGSLSSFSFGSGFGSLGFGSIMAGSGFFEWEWEWERLFGSFSKGSFNFGSGYAALLSMLKKSGSFGSFGYGSFGMKKLLALDIFGEVKNGSFVGKKLPDFFEKLDEYDRIMLMSLYGCPLNQFGYGIHNI